jgi:hypothetical protein
VPQPPELELAVDCGKTRLSGAYWVPANASNPVAATTIGNMPMPTAIGATERGRTAVDNRFK